MYDQITLKLNVDPFILGALKEDITSEDVSTNSVMPEACMGKVELICKQDGIICGLQVFKRVFELLDEELSLLLELELLEFLLLQQDLFLDLVFFVDFLFD